jgi:hypothetical protein
MIEYLLLRLDHLF